MRQRTWKPTGKGRSAFPGVLLPGLLTALGALALLLAGTAAVILRGTLPPEGAVLPARVCYTAAAAVGCWLTARRARAGKLLWAALTGLGIFILAAGAGLACTDGSETNLIPLMVLTALSVLAGGLLGARQRRRGYE